MRFTVDEIIAGWLNVTFDMGSDVFCILATDVWKTDSARQLIKACSDALSGDGSFYAVLDNEPGAWAVEINGSGLLRYISARRILKAPLIRTSVRKLLRLRLTLNSLLQRYTVLSIPIPRARAAVNMKMNGCLFPMMNSTSWAENWG